MWEYVNSGANQLEHVKRYNDLQHKKIFVKVSDRRTAAWDFQSFPKPTMALEKVVYPLPPPPLDLEDFYCIVEPELAQWLTKTI
jgi:hypothetical protein